MQKTSDGQLVCIHDATVNRTTDGTGNVASLTLDQIERLDAGSSFAPAFAHERIPTVEEVLQLIADHRQHEFLVAVDLKADGVGPEVVRLAERHQILNHLLFIGATISEAAVRASLKRSSKEARTATLANTPDEFSSALAAANTDWVYVRFLPSKEQVGAAHRVGRRVFIAGPTVSGNLPDNWRRAADAQIDGILTDYPLELAAMLRARRAP